MGIIDIIIICLIILGALIGFFKGFVKQIFALLNTLASIVVAYFITKPLTNVLANTGLATKINTTISNWIIGKAPALDVEIVAGEATEQISNAITELGVPKFLSDIISKSIGTGALEEGQNLVAVLSEKIGYAVLGIFVFIIVLILFIIIIKLLERLFTSLVNSGGLRAINRFLGLALALVKVVLIISVLMLGLNALAGLVEAVNDFVIGDLKIGQEAFSIGKFFYENNPLMWIYNQLT